VAILNFVTIHFILGSRNWSNADGKGDFDPPQVIVVKKFSVWIKSFSLLCFSFSNFLESFEEVYETIVSIDCNWISLHSKGEKRGSNVYDISKIWMGKLFKLGFGCAGNWGVVAVVCFNVIEDTVRMVVTMMMVVTKVTPLRIG